MYFRKRDDGSVNGGRSNCETCVPKVIQVIATIIPTVSFL